MIFFYFLLIMTMVVVQISFLNPSHIGFNLILIVILSLIFLKKDFAAILTAWAAGFFMGLTNYGIFGTQSLILTILTAILIIIRKNISFAAKLENMLLAGAGSVVFYRFLEWAINNILAYFKGLRLETLGFYFFNREFLSGIIIMTFFSFLFFNVKNINVKKIF